MGATVTDYSAAVLECLATLDAPLMRKLWAHLRPNLSQPESDGETLATMHLARTECPAIEAWQRMYSHSWLRERALPSLLPDHMRASAERMYPIVARAVGISVNATSPLLRQVAAPVRTAMETAVMEAFADHASDGQVTRRMMEARRRELGKLLGKAVS
jgi:hypothetical protein